MPVASVDESDFDVMVLTTATVDVQYFTATLAAYLYRGVYSNNSKSDSC